MKFESSYFVFSLYLTFSLCFLQSKVYTNENKGAAILNKFLYNVNYNFDKTLPEHEHCQQHETQWPDLNRVQAVMFHLRLHCEAISKPPLVS